MIKMGKTKILSVALSLTMLLSCIFAVNFDANAAKKETVETAASYNLANNVQDGVILHAWNWSYNNIKNNMQKIAEAGFSAVQTSPVTQPKDYKWQGEITLNVGTPNGQGGNDGQWWKVYQPVTMSICNNGETWFGTKAEFKAMCDEAHKYGVKIIVDIVANHMGNITGWKNSLSDVSPQIGTFWKPDMLTDATYWHINDIQVWHSDGRKDVTQGTLGMPDLNTKDKRVQKMVLDLLNECTDAGADGFRFDAAKHIEMPDDDASFASDFWPTVLNGAKSHADRELYFYGEILNRVGDGLGIGSYTKYMSVTDNATGDNKRNDIRYANAGSASNSSMAYDPKKTVLWAESHDTYMGGGSSYLATDDMLTQTWAMVGSRKDATALYFARPYYSDKVLDKSNYTSDQKLKDQISMGDIGTNTWCSKEISAINNFHNYFIGQSESLSSNNSNICYNERGTSGVVIAKLDGKGAVDIQANKMAAGTYIDQVSGGTFTVSGGRIKGTVTSNAGIAVVYNTSTIRPTEPSSIVNSTSATTATNSTKATLESQVPTYPSIPGQGLKLAYDNSVTNWSEVYCYIYADDAEYAKWPGTKMTKYDDNMYMFTVPDGYENGRAIFSNNADSQIPGANEPGLEINGESKVYKNGQWTILEVPNTTQLTEPTEITVPTSPTPSSQPVTDPQESSTVTLPTQISSINTDPQESKPIFTTFPIPTSTQKVSTTPSTITTDPVKGKKGDANKDGTVNIRDATCIQKWIIETIDDDKINLEVSDVNNDGKINIRDATHIQKWILELITDW